MNWGILIYSLAIKRFDYINAGYLNKILLLILLHMLSNIIRLKTIFTSSITTTNFTVQILDKIIHSKKLIV